MANDYYNRQSEMNPGEVADGLAMEQEFDAIARGFAKLPTPHRDGGGFEGATRVGDPLEKSDAVNLGSLEKLNLPIYRKKITNEDWNSITMPGIYDVVGASGANKPPVYIYGVLNIYHFNGVVIQVYWPDTNDTCVLAKRTCKNIQTSDWSSWGLLLPDNIKGACLVNAIGTGAPNEVVSSALPANIAVNSRYVLTNPFGQNVPVECFAEVFFNGVWSDPGWLFGTTVASGTKATYVQGVGIVVQTGPYAVCDKSNLAGGGHGQNSSYTTAAPCRVFIRRIDD